MQILGIEVGHTFVLSRKFTYLFVLTSFFLPILFAIYTNHAWEDWYITYRAGKNLSLGNGLVFNIGERVHTFTSPINVLLPALLNYLTQNTSDHLVLWLYRIIGAMFLSASTYLLIRILKALSVCTLSSLIVLTLFVSDTKIIDYTINGQEAAFWVFFSSLMLYCFLVNNFKSFLLLGFAWAGMMWSRPDSVVYIASFCASVLMFNFFSGGKKQVFLLFHHFLRSGLFVLLLYGPWTIWTLWYYGDVIPHSIQAKGQWLADYNVIQSIIDFIAFPIVSLYKQTSLEATLLPSYALLGGWSTYSAIVGKVIAWITAMYWLVPTAKKQIRIISLLLMFVHYYLSFFTPFVYPWYYPVCILLTFIVLGGIVNDLWHYKTSASSKNIVAGLCVLLVVSQVMLSVLSAYQLKIQQHIIEDNNRTQIGLWLKNNASSEKDTVFLEPLGYIGFYSGLKTYDYPGMSSPEVVKIRKELHTENWNILINKLHPDWLVLRPIEVSRLRQSTLNKYRKVKTFDQRLALSQYTWIPGQEYLEYDQSFYIFKKR